MAVNRSEYSARARYWDCFKPDRTDEVEFWARLAQHYGNRVLAPMAATGEVAINLARKGFDVLAIDYCSEMVKVCRERASNIPNFECVQGDITDLDINTVQFDFVFLGACDYQRLCDPDDQNIALDNIHSLLRPCGGLAIEMMPPQFAGVSRSEHTFEPWRPPPSTVAITMTSSSTYEPESHIHRIIRRMHVRELDVEFDVEYEVPLQMLSRVEIKSQLAQHGFHRIVEYGDYDRSVYAHRSPRWIMHSERKSGC